MAKSIRSKCKRKNRSEFRRTIGEAAYQKQQAQVQEKLKDCVEKQSMKSYERLSNLLQPNADEEPQVMETNLGIDAFEASAVNLKGENKAPVKKGGKRRKHALKTKKEKKAKNTVATEQKPAEKRRPKFFVQF